MSISELRADGLAAGYGNIDVVSGVTFELDRGQWLGICGANGAGKTTLVNALAGFLPVSSGNVFLRGSSIASNAREQRDSVALAVPAAKLPGTLRVGDVIEIMASSGVDRDDPIISTLLAHLELERFMRSPIDSLSSGWRQRLSILSAFFPTKAVTILDEPFNWLDPISSAKLASFLRSLVEDGLTLISCEHDLATLAQRCDRALLMKGGRTAAMFDECQLRAARDDFASFENKVIALMA